MLMCRRVSTFSNHRLGGDMSRIPTHTLSFTRLVLLSGSFMSKAVFDNPCVCVSYSVGHSQPCLKFFRPGIPSFFSPSFWQALPICSGWPSHPLGLLNAGIAGRHGCTWLTFSLDLISSTSHTAYGTSLLQMRLTFLSISSHHSASSLRREVVFVRTLLCWGSRGHSRVIYHRATSPGIILSHRAWTTAVIPQESAGLFD